MTDPIMSLLTLLWTLPPSGLSPPSIAASPTRTLLTESMLRCIAYCIVLFVLHCIVAMDLVDEAAAKLKIEVTSKTQVLGDATPTNTHDPLTPTTHYCYEHPLFPTNTYQPSPPPPHQAIDELDRRIIQLQMERLSVARDEKEDSPRIANLDKQIQILQREQEGESSYRYYHN